MTRPTRVEVDGVDITPAVRSFEFHSDHADGFRTGGVLPPPPRLPQLPTAGMLAGLPTPATDHARRIDEHRARALTAGYTAEAWQDQVDRLTRWARHHPHAVDVPAAALDLLLRYGQPVDPDQVAAAAAVGISAALDGIRDALQPVWDAIRQTLAQLPRLQPPPASRGRHRRPGRYARSYAATAARRRRTRR